jgi:hypothetical protein
MNISTGISEIRNSSLSGSQQVKNRTFIWPAYTNGKVEKIKNVQARSPEPIYYKSSPAEHNKILESMQKSRNEYNASGKISRAAAHIRPGSLFNAIA